MIRNKVQCAKCGEVKPKAEFYRRDTKRGVTSWCKICYRKWQRERKRNQYHNDPEYRTKVLESCREYQSDPEAKKRKCLYDKKYRQDMKKHPSRYRAYLDRKNELRRQRRADLLYRTKENEQQRRRRADPLTSKRMRELDRRRWRKRYATDPAFRQSCINRSQVRRSCERSNGGSFTADDWQKLCFLCGENCLACGEVRKSTVDHIVPVSKGGSSDISNIQPLCKSCNSRKHVDIIDYRPDYVKEMFE